MPDPSKLDYQQLKVFSTLLEECSVTRAAARLELTQPTVSAVLKKLRAQFGDPLFVRAQRGVSPTAKAESMAGEIRDILDRMETLGASPDFDPHAQPHGFVISARDFSQRVILAPLVQRLHHDYPKIRLRINALSATVAAERMAASTVDLALMSMRFAPPNVLSELVLEDPYVCVVDAASKLARKTELTQNDLSRAEHVSVVASDYVANDHFTEFFAAEGIQSTVKYGVDGFLMIPHLLQGTECVGVLPESLAMVSPQPLKTYPMPVPFPNLKVAMLWTQRVENDPGNRWLREQVREVCAELKNQQRMVA